MLVSITPELINILETNRRWVLHREVTYDQQRLVRRQNAQRIISLAVAFRDVWGIYQDD